MVYTIATECSTAGYYYVMKAENIDDAINKYLNTLDEKEREKVLYYGSTTNCVVLREEHYTTTIKEANFENLDTAMIFIGSHEG